MIVVTTPTGRIGSRLLTHLLDARAEVRVIARDPSKLAPSVRERVEVIHGSADDASVLNRAFDGAESVFWVVPTGFAVPDVMAYYLDYTRPAADAIKARGVRRVVAVSSLGRKLGRSAGAISASFAKDELLERTGAHFRGLACPGFMENTFMDMASLKVQGACFLPSKPDLKVPLAAVRDIAAVGARLLLDTTWTGTGDVDIRGPEDLSANERATILGEVLGRPIAFRQLSGADYSKALVAHGATPGMAQALIEMFAAIDDGLYGEPRTPESTTPTTYRQWCEEIFKPAFLA